PAARISWAELPPGSSSNAAMGSRTEGSWNALCALQQGLALSARGPWKNYTASGDQPETHGRILRKGSRGDGYLHRRADDGTQQTFGAPYVHETLPVVCVCRNGPALAYRLLLGSSASRSPVPEQVEGQDRQEDGQAGNDHEHRVGGVVLIA